MIRKFVTALVAAFGTLFLIWLIGWGWFATHVATIEPQNISQKTDAIIVLTGGKHRVETGINLLREKSAKELFISGVNADVTINDLVSKQPVPCCITLGYEATDTVENGYESARWIKDNDVESIRLVTSNYHMARAGIIFHHHSPQTEIIRHPVEPDNFQPWGQKFWTTTFGEYNKTIATWVRLSMDGRV
ncbi:MAG: YdcF family protein [Pseudomonadota bacterium]